MTIMELHFEVVDEDFTEGMAEKVRKNPGEFVKRTQDMLDTIQRDWQFFIPRGQGCSGKGGTTKSAIRTRPTNRGGEVYADEGTAPWFKWFEDGRGTVRPRKAKALRFCIQGTMIFTKKSGPSQPAKSMEKGKQMAEPTIRRKAEELGKYLSEK